MVHRLLLGELGDLRENNDFDFFSNVSSIEDFTMSGKRKKSKGENLCQKHQRTPHRRQHPERIAAQQHQVSRVRAHARDPRVVDVVDGVGRARVLGDGVGVKVDVARVFVKHDVLEDGAEADGFPDLGLLRRLEADALGVAAACFVFFCNLGRLEVWK